MMLNLGLEPQGQLFFLSPHAFLTHVADNHFYVPWHWNNISSFFHIFPSFTSIHLRFSPLEPIVLTNMIINLLLVELEVRQHLERGNPSSNFHFEWINKMWYHGWTQVVIKYLGLQKCLVVDSCSSPWTNRNPAYFSQIVWWNQVQLGVVHAYNGHGQFHTKLLCWSCLEQSDCTGDCLKMILNRGRGHIRQL